MVFILIGEDGEYRNISTEFLGAFSTKEKADDYKRKLEFYDRFYLYDSKVDKDFLDSTVEREKENKCIYEEEEFFSKRYENRKRLKMLCDDIIKKNDEKKKMSRLIIHYNYCSLYINSKSYDELFEFYPSITNDLSVELGNVRYVLNHPELFLFIEYFECFSIYLNPGIIFNIN
jgi:hypothetical protein